MNAQYSLLELHTGKHGAVEYCDLQRAAVKTQTSMKTLFKGLEKNHGHYKTRKFKLIDRMQRCIRAPGKPDCYDDHR